MRMREISGGAPLEILESGGFRLGGETVAGAALAVGGRLREWAAESVDGMDPASLAAVAEAGADLLLMGTGERRQPVPEPVRRAMAEAGVAVESMSTDSAARAYNALLDDPREVAAALLAARRGESG